jgi:putative transcriptional regulator
MVTVVLPLLLLPLAAEATAAPVKPEAGVFLVAKPSIDGGPFWQSVVLLLQHDENGTLGLIVNRATDVPLSEAVPDLERDGTKFPLHFGGPVALDGLLFLFAADEPPDGVAHVMGSVYFSGDRKILDRLLKKSQKGHRLKVFLGHSGWAPGQLLSEIARGSWELVRADAHTVFEKDPEKMWKDLSHAGTVIAEAQGAEADPSAATSEKTSSAVHSLPR